MGTAGNEFRGNFSRNPSGYNGRCDDGYRGDDARPRCVCKSTAYYLDKISHRLSCLHEERGYSPKKPIERQTEYKMSEERRGATNDDPGKISQSHARFTVFIRAHANRPAFWVSGVYNVHTMLFRVCPAPNLHTSDRATLDTILLDGAARANIRPVSRRINCINSRK